MQPINNRVKGWFQGAFVTNILVLVNVIVFLLMSVTGGTTNINNLIRYGAMVPASIKAGSDYFSIFASMFIHIGIEHLVLNMITLYFLGRILEVIMGHWKFLAAYLLAGIFGNLVSLYFSSPQTISAGASGAIFGIIGVWLMLAITFRNVPYLAQMGQQMLIFTILGLIGGFLGPDVDIAAHLGGVLAGFLLGFIMGFPKIGKIPVWQRIGSLVVLVGLTVVLTDLAFTF